MAEHQEKAPAQKSNSDLQQNINADGVGGVQFEDNRTSNLSQLQAEANTSPQVNKTAQLQAMANQFTSQQHQPIQKKASLEPSRKENNTGLPDNLKSGIENLSGHSMDDVKVHYNSDKPAQLNAHAYAQGSDIHLGSGQEKHLPHEAWHVVQQKQGRVKPTMQMKGNPSTKLRTGVNVNDDAGLEKEADVMGARAVRTSSAAKTKTPIVSKSNPARETSTKQLVQVPYPKGGKKHVEIGTDEKKFRLWLVEVKEIKDEEQRIQLYKTMASKLKSGVFKDSNLREEIQNLLDILKDVYPDAPDLPDSKEIEKVRKRSKTSKKSNSKKVPKLLKLPVPKNGEVKLTINFLKGLEAKGATTGSIEIISLTQNILWLGKEDLYYQDFLNDCNDILTSIPKTASLLLEGAESILKKAAAPAVSLKSLGNIKGQLSELWDLLRSAMEGEKSLSVPAKNLPILDRLAKPQKEGKKKDKKKKKKTLEVKKPKKPKLLKEQDIDRIERIGESLYFIEVKSDVATAVEKHGANAENSDQLLRILAVIKTSKLSVESPFDLLLPANAKKHKTGDRPLNMIPVVSITNPSNWVRLFTSKTALGYANIGFSLHIGGVKFKHYELRILYEKINEASLGDPGSYQEKAIGGFPSPKKYKSDLKIPKLPKELKLYRKQDKKKIGKLSKDTWTPQKEESKIKPEEKKVGKLSKDAWTPQKKEPKIEQEEKKVGKLSKSVWPHEN